MKLISAEETRAATYWIHSWYDGDFASVSLNAGYYSLLFLNHLLSQAQCDFCRYKHQSMFYFGAEENRLFNGLAPNSAGALEGSKDGEWFQALLI